MNKVLAVLGAACILLSAAPTHAAYNNAQTCRTVPTKRISLTFDADMTAGMHSRLENKNVTGWYNRELIDYLEENNIEATLFLTGMWAETYPEDARKLADNPLFEIANHSYSHPGFTDHCYGLETVTEGQKKYELYHSKYVIRQITGVDTKLFRFPGGCETGADRALVESMGMRAVGWDILSGDSFSTDTVHIVNNMIEKAHDGAIIVAHMHAGPNAPKTAAAVKIAVPRLQARGYKFVKASELMPQGVLIACSFMCR